MSEGEQSPQRSRWGRWAERLLDPLGWSPAERCLLVIAILLPGSLVFVLLINFRSGWPYLPPGADRAAMRELGALAWWVLAPWSGLGIAAMVARRRQTRADLLVPLTIQAYALTIAAFTYITGPLYSPGWMAAMGGAMVGFLLFERAAALVGILTFVLGLVAAMVAGRQGWIPVPVRAEPLAGGGLIGFGVTAVLFMGFTMGLAMFLITRWRQHERNVVQLSRTDALTGLTNRRRFLEVFERELARAARYKRPLSCVLVDLDRFKHVNDTHGHEVGDRVLVASAQALARGLREADLVARWGGEEFALLLPDTGAVGAMEVATRCLDALRAARTMLPEGPLGITASMGVVEMPPGGARAKDLLRVADEALYRAKAEGRDRVVLGQAGLGQAADSSSARPSE